MTGSGPYSEVAGDFPDAKGAVSVGVEDALRSAGRAGVGEPDLAAGRSRRRGGGAVGEARGGLVVGEVTLPGVRRSVGCARGFVREALLRHAGPAEAGTDEAVTRDAVRDDMVTVTSELVANAVTHTASGRAGGEVAVVLVAGDGVYRLEVADDGAADGHPHLKDEEGAETGRGMRIVEALAARWGFRTDGRRTVVWAEFPAPAAEGRGRAPLSGPG